MSVAWLAPGWTIGARVRAAFSLREGGISLPPYDALNVGIHVGDDAQAVATNRARLAGALALPAEPLWLRQVHGNEVLHVRSPPGPPPDPPPEADAVVTRLAGVVLAIQVADCLPVLLAEPEGSVIAAAHAGWRGLAGGVLENVVQATGVDPARLCAWIGPGIGPAAFEVGPEVRAAFVEAHAADADCFAANARGRWQCDLAQLARRRLARAGLAATWTSGECTASDPRKFYSHRRDGRCGRHVALIWREPG